MSDSARFSIEGKPAGRTFHVGGKRFVSTNPVDGGATFSPEDQKYLSEHGYKLVKAAAKAPIADPEDREISAAADERIKAQNAKAREEQAVRAQDAAKA
jgi:hypothetical protein